MTTDRVMVITGGSRGIGASTALLAAQAGYRIVVNYASNAQAADEIVKKVEALGSKAIAVQGDVASEADIIALFEAADSFGQLSALINNAGVILHPMPLVEMSAERIEKSFRINVLGSYLCAREAIKRMARSRGGAGGAIINLTSAAAKLGSPKENVDYAGTKGAIDSFTVGLAKELAMEGIRVCAVRPGIIDTEIHASGGQPDRLERIVPTLTMQRAGTAEEVAKAILWLASDDAAYSTGAILDVSGGRAILP